MVLAVAVLCCASDGLAQTSTEESDQAMLRFGPLGLTPSFAMTNFGLESNVFNEPHAPKSDTTATFTPNAKVWLRAGPVLFSGASRVDAVVFQQYQSQNTISASNTVRADISLNRFQPYVSGSFMRFNDRPDVEIDSRVVHHEQAMTAGLLVRVASRTFVRLSEERSGLTFVQGGTFRGRDLQALNRTQTLHGAAVEYDLTPVSQLQLTVQREDTRFAHTPDRNAHGLRATTGLAFKPRAFLTGFARVGVLRYRPDDPAVPPFSGLIASANVRSIIGGNALSAEAERDLFYSIDAQVYYLQTRVSLALARQLTDRWSATGAAAAQWLAYSSNGAARLAGAAPIAASFTTGGLIATPGFVSSRPDTVSTVGAGIGYRLTRNATAGFGVSYSHRDAALESGRYDNFRAVGSVTYGAP